MSRYVSEVDIVVTLTRGTFVAAVGPWQVDEEELSDANALGMAFSLVRDGVPLYGKLNDQEVVTSLDIDQVVNIAIAI